MLGVTKCDQRGNNAAPCSKLLRWPRKNEKRFTTFFFTDIDITPTHCLADSGAERLRHCFLRSEARSQMALREFHRHRIFDLAIGKNAVQKTISESINGMLNACALDQINADANYAHFATRTDRPGIVKQALRYRVLRLATGAVALQIRGNVRDSSGILRHGSEYFFHGGFEPHPHRARDDGMANIEFG